MQRFPGTDTTPTPQVIACRIEQLLDEQSRVVDELLSTETSYIEAVARARHAGLLDSSELRRAHDRLRGWGISNFSGRWLRLVGVAPEEFPVADTVRSPDCGHGTGRGIHQAPAASE
ncbi:hypothetical protein [Nocardia sp. X0981]